MLDSLLAVADRLRRLGNGDNVLDRIVALRPRKRIMTSTLVAFIYVSLGARGTLTLRKRLHRGLRRVIGWAFYNTKYSDHVQQRPRWLPRPNFLLRHYRRHQFVNRVVVRAINTWVAYHAVATAITFGTIVTNRHFIASWVRFTMVVYRHPNFHFVGPRRQHFGAGVFHRTRASNVI